MLDASLDEMAQRLNIARRLVAGYRKNREIPASVARYRQASRSRSDTYSSWRRRPRLLSECLGLSSGKASSIAEAGLCDALFCGHRIAKRNPE